MLQKYNYSLIFALVLSLSIFSWPFLLTQAASDTLSGLNQTANEVGAFKLQAASSTNYNTFLQTRAGEIIGTVLSFVGVLFLGLMIYAGILWMTAQGNEQQISKAKGMLTNAIIGLIVVFAAYAITTFIGTEILK